MSSKRITQRIDQINYTTCYRLVQKYYLWKEGANKGLVDLKLLKLLITRLFCLVILVFRLNRYPHKINYQGNPKNFIRQLLGFHNFWRADVPQKKKYDPPIVFPSFDTPLVTIIIAVFNQWEFTYACLSAILENTTDITYRIVVVNDCSTDETAAGLKKCENITVIQNAQNYGFLRSCNNAAQAVTSKYICFLNNDTMVQKKWLHHMISVFKSQEFTGVVGAKLVYPYGLLQEAGGLVNASGKPANFGRGEDPTAYKYNYLRETDYCSGACIVIEKDDFFKVNGFDDQYAPAYYEDTDLCFAVRYKLGKKVFYQPLSEVVHFEGVSSGKRPEQGNVKSYQLVNAKTFVTKWAPFFRYFSNSDRFEDQVDKFSQNRRKILFIDGTLPFYDKDSGSRRMYELIKIFLSLNFEIYFFAEFSESAEPYKSDLVTKGVRLICRQGARSKTDVLKEIAPALDYAWICRPHLNEKYAPLIRQYRKASWIYDTVDLHYLRLERSLKFDPSQGIEKITIEALRKQEIGFAQAADLTIVVTQVEAAILKKEGAGNVKVIPNIHYVKDRKAAPLFEQRNGLCFIGSYEHLPNVDAVLWLVKEIMPVIWQRFPAMKLILLGSNPPQEVLALRSGLVEVPGYLHDVSSFFYHSRLFVAPLRYGAGMKGKIGQAMEYGLPVITTDIGVEGMELVANRDVVLANDTKSFATAILDLYHDKERWTQLSENSLESVKRYSPRIIKDIVEELFVS